MNTYRYTKDHMGELHYADFFRDRDTHGWEEAMARLVSRPDIIKPQKIPMFLSDQRRNDFIFLLPLSPDAVALDFGSGWGNTSFTLSHYCKQVVAMEADASRLRFSASHFRHTGADNIVPIQSGNAGALPFADATFDIVVMNGVLEWTPRSVEGRPEEVHRKVLSEVRRVLKPGGTLAVSIENRYSYKWLTGIPDHHAGGLRWGSFLPRWAANLYSWVRLRQPYRAWLYGNQHVRKLFTDSGFLNPSLHSYHPNHVTFKHLFRVDDDTNARKVLREVTSLYKLRWRDKLAYRLALLGIPYRWIAHDYLVVMHKPETDATTGSFFERLVAQHSGVKTKIEFDLRSATRAVLLEATTENHPVAVLKFPRASRWNGNIETEAGALSTYRKLGVSSPVQVPQIMHHGTVFDRPLVLTTHVPGEPAVSSELYETICPQLRGWLVEIARKRQTSEYTADPAPTVRWHGEAISAIGAEISPYEPDPRLAGLRGVLVHGDLSPNNILAGDQGLSVVDWEFADPDGLPLVDLIDFLLYCHYRSARDYETAWRRLFSEPAGEAHRHEIYAYCDALDIDHALIPLLAQQFLLKKMALLIGLDEKVSQRKLDQLASVYRMHNTVES